tara:strand:- start:1143 stop:1922 length:780 start_codon:yes stop_codon:yes gene_type:complete
MTDQELILAINDKVIEVYNSESIIPLRGEKDSYELNGKQILVWYFETTRHCFCHFNNDHFDYNKNIDDLLYTSDEIVYFLAHLYLYKPYINNPIKDAFYGGETMFYPMFLNLEGKRYDMYLGVVFEKIYNFWDRIGDLIASYFPNRFKGNVYFSKTIKDLKTDYGGNVDYDWLLNFMENEFTTFNKERINIVHYVSKNTEQKWEQLGEVTDYKKTKEFFDKRISYPDYFKDQNEKTKIGFEKTINLLEEINKREQYNCG